MPPPSELDGRDGIVAMLLFAAAVAYLALVPRNLGLADESYFLYEAKRIREGEVMYRDFFQFVTPLSSYLMAGLFALFGTSMATARISMAVLHATTGVLLYATARRLGVRRGFAALVVLAYLAICQAVWPYASWHWFSTLLAAALLFAMVAGPLASRPGWGVVPGVVSGLMIGVQQQKGVFAAAGVGAVFVLDHLLCRREPSPAPWAQLETRLACFAAGVAVVVVPLLAVFVGLAGVEPVYAALVRFPLENYRSNIHIDWGAAGFLSAHYAEYTMPRLLRYSPAALVLPVLAGLRAMRCGDRQRVRQLIALIILSACAALSVWYYPDTIHIAFIAAGFWLCAAVGVEWLLASLPGARPARLAAALVEIAITAVLGLHMFGYVRQLRREFPIAHETAFGRVDFAARWQVLLVDHVRGVLAASPDKDIFYYPPAVSMYLLTGGHNPTPYQYLLPGVSPEEHTSKTLAMLRDGRVPYVITWPFGAAPRDPIVQYIRENYEIVSVPEVGASGERTEYRLFARKDRARPNAPMGS